ncbi:MAG: ATP-binding protein, partial [Pirellulales bacterium]
IPSSQLTTKISHESGAVQLLDSSKPAGVRGKTLFDYVVGSIHDPAELIETFTRLLDNAGKTNVAEEAAKAKAAYEQKLAELDLGAVRPATFIGQAPPLMPGGSQRVHVVTPDGQERFPILTPNVAMEDLSPATTVFLDEKGLAVLGTSNAQPRVGEQATFLRRLPDSREIEVSCREDKLMVYAADSVLQLCDNGELSHGDRVLFCPRRLVAFAKIPAEENFQHRFVDRSKIPDVVASRDIGRPHWVLQWMIRRTRIMMFRDDLLQRFDLRPRCTVLLTGPTGTGKTLTIRAFMNEFYKLVVERTGRDDLGSRVVRIKASDLLSEWYGRTEKNIDEVMDNIQSLAAEEIETTDGQRIELPVIVILEEAEGLARRRGEHDGSVHDRTMGTLLQRLDDPTDDLGKLPLIIITTSNRPDLFDSAMWRRLAGIRAHFKRLDRQGVAAVLGKKLKPDYPFASHSGHSGTTPHQLRSDAIDQVVSWMFSPNGEDQGQIEVTMRDAQKLIKYRRDFCTGSVVETAVANEIDRVVFAAEESDNGAGLTANGIIDSLRDVVDGLADNLTAHNVTDYIDLPEHASVASVRRLGSSNGRLGHVTI